MDALNNRQQAFVDEYLLDLNATQAAIRAGYSRDTAAEIGAENLRKPQIASAVQAALASRAARTGVKADQVVNELAALAFYDPGALAAAKIDGPEGIADLPENVRRAILGWSWDKQGNFVLKLSPKTPALEMLGRHLGMFTDRRQVDVTVRERPVRELSREELMAIAAGNGE